MRAYVIEIIRDGDNGGDEVEKVGTVARYQQAAEDYATAVYEDIEFNFGNTTVFGLVPAKVKRKEEIFNAKAILAGGRLFYENLDTGKMYHARCKTVPEGVGTKCLIYNDDHWVSLPMPYPRKSLYVGNLSWDTVSDDIFTLFSQYSNNLCYCAQVSCDRKTGDSRGYGFVEMETQKAADEVKKQLNNYQFMGRVITVGEAKERPRSIKNEMAKTA